MKITLTKAIALGALILLADRISKALMLKFLAPAGTVVFAPFFRFTYVENTGAAFGMLAGRNAFFVIITVLLLGGIFYYRRQLAEHGKMASLAMVFICAGAVGNLYDRLAYGYVVDFLDFRVWPVFNLADSFISAGGVLLAWAFYFNSPDEKKAPSGMKLSEEK
ncbi:MAG: signal peptidase II [Elusimicrobiaceae bacterium]